MTFIWASNSQGETEGLFSFFFSFLVVFFLMEKVWQVAIHVYGLSMQLKPVGFEIEFSSGSLWIENGFTYTRCLTIHYIYTEINTSVGRLSNSNRPNRS